jgi:phosphoribosylaminoimidazole carboxylase (NCAIR synthetase)
MNRQKKIVLLIGAFLRIPDIKAAHELGCYVITVDYLPDNIAHTYSDEYQYASTIDKEAVLEIAKRCEIDGILTFTDSGVVTAGYVADQLGLPMPGPYESIQILQNKGLFRKFLAEHGFNVPKAKSLF